MAIIFGSDTGLRQDAASAFWDNSMRELKGVVDGLKNAFSLTPQRPPQAPREAVHVDNGFTNVPGTAFIGSSIDNVDDIQQRRIVTQEPILTVYVKKRAFRSLRNENDAKYLDNGEKLFLRATKILFEKKCQQLGAYEALTKAKSMIDEETSLDLSRIQAVVEVVTSSIKDQMALLKKEQKVNDNTFFTADSATWVKQARSIYKRLQALTKSADEMAIATDGLKTLSDRAGSLRHATKTTWTVDPEQADVFLLGRGSGVIELTLISDLSSSLNIDGSPGSIDFTIQDPYNLTKITNDDIESALAAAKLEMDDVEHTWAGPQKYYEDAIKKEETLREMRKDRVAKAFGISNSGNAVLSGSDATEIVFEVQPSSSAANRVVAHVGSIPEAFNKSNYAIAMLQLPLEQQLTPDEHKLVVEIFTLLEEYVKELMRINNNYIMDNHSSDVEHARRNLRVHYLGKAMIQPMDSVNVYIRSNTFEQNELIGPLSSLLNDTNFIKAFESDTDVSLGMLEEEMKVLHIDDLGIPVELYQAIRTGSLMRNAGTHVFGGIITTVSESYDASGGTYKTRISGASNMQWLDQSRVNVAPSLDQTQGILEDPLTSFDIEVDPATGLIREAKSFPPLNVATQNRLDAGLIFFNDGIFLGDKLSKTTMIQDYFDNGDGTSIPQFKHAPGLAYKWKQGVMVATRNINLKTALDGSEDQSAKLRREMGMTVIQNPFSGQDAADIVSLLVTGFPHNYESFYENAMSVGTYGNSNSTNNPETYFHSFFDIQRSQNRSFGNFQPFKTIQVNPSVMHERLAQQQYLKEYSQNLNRLRSELAKLLDRRDALKNNGLIDLKTAPTSDEDKKLQIEAARVQGSIDSMITALQNQISQLSTQFKAKADNAKSLGLRLYGSDIAFDFYGTSAESEDKSREETYKKIRLRHLILQFRPQYNCKFNTDDNLFIVGDEYDKDLDIQAFVSNMSGNTNVFDSQFKTPKEICKQVAQVLDFEFFCNTQGHIEFRPPRYNKVPLSLMLKMLLLDQQEGKKLYPPFLTSLFNTKKQSIENELKIVDLNIQIEGILLNRPQSAESLSQLVVGGGADTLYYDSKKAATNTNINTQDLAGQLLVARQTLRGLTAGQAVNPVSEKDRAAASEDIKALNDPTRTDMYVKRKAHFDKLAQLVSRRQRLLDMKNKADVEAKKFEAMPNNISQNMSPTLLNQLGDVLEDDMNDFLGPNSSKRFIIYDHHIISSNFTESSDNVVCRVDVNGEQDLIGEGPGNIGGVPVLWAGATDFDLWRQYGYRSDGGVSRPFLKDAETQCAPYAMMLLSRNRKNAVQGNITVAGNEYYQLGDVVYINSRDTLYYVTAISHSFSYEGGNFTTTLNLQYGRTLGDYIPTPLDVIGKSIIKSQKNMNQVITSRKTTGQALGRHIATIIFPSNGKLGFEKKEMLSGPYGRFNLNELKNTLMIANKHVFASYNEQYPKLEVRGFAFDGETMSKAQNRMGVVREWLKNPCGLYTQETPNTEGKYMLLSKTYTDKKIDKKWAKFQISSFNEPVMLLEDLKRHNNYLRIPKEEVFGLIVGTDPSKLADMIEIVMIFEDIEKIQPS